MVDSGLQTTHDNPFATFNISLSPYTEHEKILGAIKMSAIKAKITEFIIENFLFGTANGLQEDTSFLEEGIIDSTGVLELVTFLEENFGIKVADEELIPENFDSINNVAAYLERKAA